MSSGSFVDSIDPTNLTNEELICVINKISLELGIMVNVNNNSTITEYYYHTALTFILKIYDASLELSFNSHYDFDYWTIKYNEKLIHEYCLRKLLSDFANSEFYRQLKPDIKFAGRKI